MDEFKFAWTHSDFHMKLSFLPKLIGMCAGYACLITTPLMIALA